MHYDNYNLHCVISIHALLAESDANGCTTVPNFKNFYPRSPCGERPNSQQEKNNGHEFLSTLSLRRATSGSSSCARVESNFYPRSPCGERPPNSLAFFLASSFLSTLSLRRATYNVLLDRYDSVISIHALLAESDQERRRNNGRASNFYPRSPCGERPYLHVTPSQIVEFLSTLSLRRATA